MILAISLACLACLIVGFNPFRYLKAVYHIAFPKPPAIEIYEDLPDEPKGVELSGPITCFAFSPDCSKVLLTRKTGELNGFTSDDVSKSFRRFRSMMLLEEATGILTNADRWFSRRPDQADDILTYLLKSFIQPLGEDPKAGWYSVKNLLNPHNKSMKNVHPELLANLRLCLYNKDTDVRDLA